MIQQKRKCNIDHEKKNNLCRKMHFPIYLSDSFLYNLTFLGTVIRATKNINIDHLHLHGLLKHTHFAMSNAYFINSFLFFLC